MIPPNPSDVIQAAAMTPAFQGAYSRAPPYLTLDGKTYARDAARNAQERIWYLAALSRTNPKAVHNLAFLGVDEMAFGFEESQVTEDPDVVTAQSALDAAKTATAQAKTDVGTQRKARDDAKHIFNNKQKQIDTMDAQVRDLEARIADVGRVKDLGDGILAGLTMGATKLVPYAELQVRLGSAKNNVMQLRADQGAVDVGTAEAEFKEATKRQKEAEAEQTKAQKALDAAKEGVRKRLRATEEAADLKQKAEDQKAAAEQAARDRQARADAAAAYASSTASDYATGEYSGEEDVQWGSNDFATTDPDAELGDPDYLDMEDQADLWGDEDLAVMMMEDTDEPMIGVNTVVSPYSFDRYYDAHRLPDDHVWGADTGQVVTGIIAGVLAAAPAIMKAVAPPPSADQSAADSSSTIDVDGFLAKVGVKKTINDAAAAAGAGAGEKGGDKAASAINTWMWVGAAVVGLVVVAKVMR